MEARILTDEREIIEAQKLAYDVLVKEQQWKIKVDNPSGLHLKYSRLGYLLVDRYDIVATWLGVFQQNRCLGCLRTTSRLNGKFELEHYYGLLDFLKQDKLSIEVNRLAIRKAYQRSIVILMLFKLLYQRLLERGGYAWGTSFWPNPGQLYVKKLGLTRNKTPFRYYPDDPEEVYIYYINGYDRIKLEENIARFSFFIERRKGREKTLNL